MTRFRQHLDPETRPLAHSDAVHPSASPSADDPPGIDPALLELMIRQHDSQTVPRLRRLWDYYRNPLVPASASMPNLGPSPRPAQALGLPGRITQPGLDALGRPLHREAVIENDIAWRVHAMVDFMFGRELTIQSRARSPRLARLIERLLQCVLDHAGGVRFFQDVALLGAVYGSCDLLLRLDDSLADLAPFDDAPWPGEPCACPPAIDHRPAAPAGRCVEPTHDRCALAPPSPADRPLPHILSHASTGART